MDSNPTRTVFTLTLASFGLWFISGRMFKKTQSKSGDDTAVFLRPFFGWGVVFVFLTIMADLDNTSQLAVSFAWLILIATFINVGYDGFTIIAKQVGV